MKIAICGTGYVGLVTGACLANIGRSVVCVDVDADKVRRLRAGECPIYEPGLQEIIVHNAAAGRLSFTSEPRDAYLGADMIFICVGTPSDERGHADLSHIFRAADDVADTIRTLGPRQKPKVIIVKSTVPVGTTLRVRDRIRERAGKDVPFRIGNNPEFLKEGAAVSDFERPDRIVCGVEDDATGRAFLDLYDTFDRAGHPIIIMDIPSSEMVKYASNNFLATKISFINEMATLCEALGADIDRVRQGMCADRRIGHEFLSPGLGYGGSCFPKDTLAVIMMGESASVPVPLSRAVHDVNQAQRARFFGAIERYFSSRAGLAGKRLAFWGLAFKPRTDDVRESPALTLVRLALERGAIPVGFDPVAGPNAQREIGPSLRLAAGMYEALEGADALVVCTDWDDFKSPDWARVCTLLRNGAVFDGRNLYSRAAMEGRGLAYHSVGRSPLHA